MDRRQNNGSVKAVSPRHCPATCALAAQLLFQLLCLGRVTKTMSVALLLTNNLDNSSKGSPAFLAQQLHLPTHDLFWAKLRVQLHLPPLRSLNLLISPGTLTTRNINKNETGVSRRCSVKVYCRPVDLSVCSCLGLSRLNPVQLRIPPPESCSKSFPLRWRGC